MSKSVFVISEMDCPSEETLIRKRLQAIQGVEHLEFNLMARELVLEHKAGDEKLIQAAIESLGMKPILKRSASASTRRADSRSFRTENALQSRPWIGIGLSGILAVLAEAIAFAQGQENSPGVIALSCLSIAIGGKGTLKKGWIAVRNFTLNINFLMMIAIAGAALIGEWPEAAMVTFLFAVAEFIEAYSLERARSSIRELMQLAPDHALVQNKSGVWVETDVSKIQVDQVIRIRPGERLPLDGMVISGNSAVNQAPITGESMPVEKKEGDLVFAGSINERGAFEFRVKADQSHTTLARIIRAVQQAEADKAPVQRFVDQFSRYYTPIMVVIAVLIALIPPLMFQAEFYPWFYKALVLLVIACPCALVISTPVTLVSGLSGSAKRGLLIKGGAYLEEGRKLKVIAFDKTGTLTYGKPKVTDVVSLQDKNLDEVLRIAASLDSHSEHPVAAAIVEQWNHVHQDGVPPLLDVSEFKSTPGKGVLGTIERVRYFIGNHRFSEEKGVCTPEVEALLEKFENEGKSTVVLGNEKDSIAIIAVADTVRETSTAAIESLHRLGLTTAMLTGDNGTTAQAIARQVGIDDVRANLLPEDKLVALQALRKKYGAIGMAGDGVNDAPALAEANVGFALGSNGTDTALETADVAILRGDLEGVASFVRMSRRTWKILIQNVTLAISIKVAFFILALVGISTLWMAVFADMGASLIVVFNGLRLLRG